MEEERKIKFNRDEFLFTVMQQFMNKDVQGVRRTYDGLINLIENGQRADLINKKEHDNSVDEEKRKILEKCLDIFRSPEIRDLIKKGNFDAKQIYSMFHEKILGDNKRQYNISSLYDENIIAGRRDGKGKCIKFTKKDGMDNAFTSLSGETIKIKCIGELNYKTQLGEESYITKYKVTRPIAGNKAETFEVYSNINMPQMSNNDEYKEMVLNELLSENNIRLSNANGYLGVITEDHSMDVGEEQKSRIRYKYKASPNYMLLGETDEMSAVKDYEQREKETKIVPEEKSKDEGEER